MELSPKDLALIRTHLLRHFSVAELQEAGLLDRLPDRSVRTQLADIDPEFFCYFYLGTHFNKPGAKMHGKLYDTIVKVMSTPGRVNAVFVLPRGFAKTTITTLGVPAWAVCTNKRHYIIIVSNSFDQAKEQLATLKEELEHNVRIQEDFGVLRGKRWQEDGIETTNDVKIIALGRGMKIRGRKYRQWRPDLILADDLENLKEAQSSTQRDHLKRWVKQSLLRAGWEDTKAFFLGNFLHHDCLLIDLGDNPLFTSTVHKAVVSWPKRADLWEEWRQVITDLADEQKEEHAYQFFLANREEMLRGAKSAWPEAFPFYDLMVMKVSEGDASFSMELQNEPTDPEKRHFRHWGKYRKEYRANPQGGGDIWLIPESGHPAVPLSACAIFGATDPSLGKATRSDPSGIILLAKAPTNQVFVLEADRKRRPPHQIMRDQEKWARTYIIARWGIEAVQFQAFYAAESARQSMQANVYLPVVPIQQSHRGGKILRIQSLQPDLENEYILLCDRGQENLEEELVQFPMGAHDDLLDALEIAWRIAQQWKSLESVGIIQGDQHQFGSMPTREGVRLHRALAADPYAEMDRLADETIRKHREEERAREAAKEEPPTPEELKAQRESGWYPATLM